MKIKILILTALFFLSCSKDEKTIDNTTEIKIPQSIEKIVSISPTTSDILIGLGLSKKIIALDDYSMRTKHISDQIKHNVVITGLLDLDIEKIINLRPDIVFVSTMSKKGGVDPLTLLSDVGIPVIYVNVGESVAEIEDSIMLVASITRTEDKAKVLIENMQKELENIVAIGKTITDKKRIYFELEPAPIIYTFGNGVFLNDVIEMIGAENIFKDQEGWISVSEESVVSLNPDIIITTADKKDNPRDVIKKRNGWDSINAVKNNKIYYIDPEYISVPTHNVIHAIKDMAKKVYKDEYSIL